LGLNYNCGTDFGCNGLGFFWSEANLAWHYGYTVLGEQFFGLVFV
jgi:hypothetical protein